MELKKQDRNGTRTTADVERRYKLTSIPTIEDDVDNLKGKMVVDSYLSTTSTNSVQNKVITENLNKKVTKEADKGLSSNDFTNADKTKLDSVEIEAQKNVIERIVVGSQELTPTNKAVKIYVDSSVSRYSENPVQNKAITKYVDDATGAIMYGLSTYKVDELNILRSSCYKKNDRVCINFVGTLPMDANTTTTLFNLPTAIRPTMTKDFVVFGQSSNFDGYIGYGYITSDGLLQVRFNEDISSYIRFNVVYDLD